MRTSRQPVALLNVPYLDYEAASQLQRRLLVERAEGRWLDTLMLVEHEPVFTLGRTTKMAHWGGNEQSLRALGYGLFQVERGGSVTYHGPGQIVGYPIFKLRNFCSGPKAYMGMLAEVLIRVLAEWGIHGKQIAKLPGVWVGDVRKGIRGVQKIAAMGVRITQGVTMHGFALNVNVDLKPFQEITPCGIEGCQVTSMAALLGNSLDLNTVRDQIALHFANVFGLIWKDTATEMPSL